MVLGEDTARCTAGSINPAAVYFLLSLPPTDHTLSRRLCWAQAGTTLVSRDADPLHVGMFTAALSQNALLGRAAVRQNPHFTRAKKKKDQRGGSGGAEEVINCCSG